MKLKVTLMMLFAVAFSMGAYAQACCTGASVSYPNGATTISYTSTVSTTTESSTTITGVGDPNVIYMEGYSVPSSTYTGTTYTGEYASSSTFYPSQSCCQSNTKIAYPSGNTATVTTYGTTTTATDYGVGAGDPNVIYMEGVTTSISTTTSIPTYTSDVGNSCCGGPGISYPSSTTGSY